MMNAGKYKHKIDIYSTVMTEDADGYQSQTRQLIMQPYAEVKTTQGMTIIRNDSTFEKAYTRFTIRYPKTVQITRDSQIEFRGKVYSIEYLNNVNEADVELEMQCKEVTH